MTDSSRDHLERLAHRTVRRLRAPPWRKACMCEELLAHLIATFDEEFDRCGEEARALGATAQRFGDPVRLGQSLRSTIPIYERILVTLLPPQEAIMSRWLGWVVGYVAILFAIGALVPQFGGFIGLGLTAILAALALQNLQQEDSVIARLLSRRVLGLIGVVAILVGASILLPAMAKINMSPRPPQITSDVVWIIRIALTEGAVVVLEGLGFIGYSLFAHRTRVA